MGNLEPFFVGILRFNIIAFVLLGTCLGFVRFVKQPLERVRIVQIGLTALLTTFLLGGAGVIPTIDLAVLPAVTSLENTPAAVPDVVGVERHSPHSNGDESEQSPLGANPSFMADVETSATTSLPMTPIGPTEALNVQPELGLNNRLAFMPMLKSMFALAFLAVSLFYLVYLTVGFIATRRLVTTSSPLSEAVRARVDRIMGEFLPNHQSNEQRNVRVVSSSSIDVPMVVGIRRPTILLPERLASPDADLMELKQSLAHEWGHVELHDLATWQLVCLCQPFLWIQPCYWILRRELRVAQDQLADQFAINQTHDHTTYATTLLELSRSRQRFLPGALAMAGGKSNLYRRINMLMNEKLGMVRVSRKSALLSFAILFAMAGGLLTSLQLTHAASPIAGDSTNQTGEDDKVAAKDAVTKIVTTEEGTKQESAEHSGVVMDVDTGKPIAGVTVTVTRMESENWTEIAVTESVTDENGKYTFTIPPDQLSQRLLYIMFDIDHPEYAQRHCGSYGYGMIVKNLENGEQPWFSEFKMLRGEKIAGRLVDDNQNPVVGAQIRSRCTPKSGGYDRIRSSSIDAVSDDDGRFEIVATHDGVAAISIIPRDHCMKHVDVGEKRGDLGDIKLSNGFTMSGIVRDAEGKPMSGLWVNLRPEDEQGASYEMLRSAKTDDEGRFTSRPLKSGKYRVEVETKATGALEKRKYANFHNTPPAAMFVTHSVNVTEDSARKPLVIQAVPHVLITLQTYKPNGEISGGHSPSLFGEFDEQRLWIREGKRTGKGGYELMAPHGMKEAELRFTTNEHSALMVQFEDGELSPRKSYRFERLEEDIDNVRVVRHSGGILKLDIVDEDGKQLEDTRISPRYEIKVDPDKKMDEAEQRMMTGASIGWNREEGMYRLSSLVPGAPVTVRFSASGFKTQTQTFTMKESERRTVTIKLKEGEDEKPDDRAGNEGDATAVFVPKAK